MKKRYMLPLAIAGIAGAFLLGLTAASAGQERPAVAQVPAAPPSSPPPLEAAPIDGIGCDAMEGKALHIHAQLQIYFNGQSVPLPAGLGITNGCTYWLHTHTDDGVIHVESPVVRTFTLGQFIDVAGMPRFGPTTRVRAFVDIQDGKGFREFKGDYRTIPLTRHAVIALGVGEFIPKPFTFAADL